MVTDILILSVKLDKLFSISEKIIIISNLNKFIGVEYNPTEVLISVICETG